MISSEQAILAALLVCVTGSVAVWLWPRSAPGIGVLGLGVTLASAVLACLAAGQTLVLGPGAPAGFLAVAPLGFALRLHVDGLTAVFLLLVVVVSVPASLYSIGYVRQNHGRHPAYYHSNFLLFLAAMYGLVSTTDMMWFFFIFWQLMTLPGYALIRFEKANPSHRRAANKYLLMMQIACLVTMVGAEILAYGSALTSSQGQKYDFHSISLNLPALLEQHPFLAGLAFALFLAGFGIKMGMWPFGHVWLPDAHPAAPSPVSAMLSGVMIKTGVYGVIRYFLWLVPSSGQVYYPLTQWGILIALLGTITLLTGTWRALGQTETKRLLAFHSIGQIGYVLLGIGVCLVLLPSGQPELQTLGALALFGALFHTFNHAVFKGLLFLNAGALLQATGTQDLNRMGGLLRLMPWTAAATLIAALSISGVPLLNGFVSKWSIYVSALQGSGHFSFLAVCALLALLTAVLTLASFTKFFGAAFLSPSSETVRRCAAVKSMPLEVPWTMRAPQLLLAVLCVVLGIAPFLASRTMQAAMEASRHGYGQILTESTPLLRGLWLGVRTVDGEAAFMPIAVLVVLALLLGAIVLAARCFPTMARVSPAWLCGYVAPGDEQRYTAHHLYGDLHRMVRPAKRGVSTHPPHADS
jgi:hydrogenase-4 component B